MQFFKAALLAVLVLLANPVMAANVKLSDIASGGALNPSTDKTVSVRNGTTDVLTTPPAAVSVTAADACGVITPSPGVGTFTIGSTNIINPQGTAASYVILSTDMCKTVTHARSTAVADTLPQAGTAGFEAGKSFSIVNLGAGAVTTTATVSTINGAGTLVLNQNQGAYLISDGTNWVAFLGSSSGVTSVGLSMPAIFTVTNSPVTSTGTLTATAAGTSGGVPYFNSATSMASSGALTANLPVIGGGAGAAPAVGTRTGNTTAFATFSGTATNGDCVSIDSNGNLVAAGGACTTGGGGGTVNAGTAGQMAYYATSTNAVSGTANATISNGVLTLGQAGSVIGQTVLSGNTSGTTTLTPAAAATGTLTLPAATDTLTGKATTDTFTNKTFNTGGTGNVFQIGGTGITAVTGTGSVMLAASPTTTGTLTAQIVAASKAVTGGVSTITVSGAAFATDASLGNTFRGTPAHSTATAMSAPSNPTDGQKITYELVQDSTGSGTVTWNAVFSFGTSGAPTLTTTANKRDLVGFTYSSDAVKWLYTGSQLNF